MHTLDGPTRFRNRMLAAHGWTVLSVPFFEWNFLTEGEPEEDGYLCCLLAPYQL